MVLTTHGMTIAVNVSTLWPRNQIVLPTRGLVVRGVLVHRKEFKQGVATKPMIVRLQRPQYLLQRNTVSPPAAPYIKVQQILKMLQTKDR